MRGVLRVTPEGTLVLTTTDSLEGALNPFLTLIQTHAPALDRLLGARLVQVKNNQFQEVRTIQKEVDTTELSLFLEACKSGTKLYFWFASQSSSAGGLLVKNDFLKLLDSEAVCSVWWNARARQNAALCLAVFSTYWLINRLRPLAVRHRKSALVL